MPDLAILSHAGQCPYSARQYRTVQCQTVPVRTRTLPTVPVRTRTVPYSAVYRTTDRLFDTHATAHSVLFGRRAPFNVTRLRLVTLFTEIC